MRLCVLTVLLCACGNRTPDASDDAPGDMMSGAPSGTGTPGDGSGATPGGSGAPSGPPNFAIGGRVTNLASIGLVLHNVNGDTLAIQGNGKFHFPIRLADQAMYDITIDAQPPNQLCTVTDGTGVVTGADVTGAQVSCTLAYPVGGIISGLASGQSVTLSNNGGDAAVFSQNGAFAFSVSVLPGGVYAVAVMSVGGGANCSVVAGSGAVSAAPVTSVRVYCLQPVQAARPGFTNWGKYYKPLGGACTGAEIGHSDRCQHAGETRTVLIGGLTQCLSKGADTLQAFVWECEIDALTGFARYSSNGFAPGKHLGDLINPANGTWRANAFHVQNAQMELLQTPSSAWWTNPIVLDDNSGSLGATGTVYVFRSNYLAQTNVTADEVSVLAVPGVTIDKVGVDTHRFTWLQGSITSVVVTAGAFNRLDAVTAANVLLSSGNAARLRDVDVVAPSGNAIELQATSAATLTNVSISGGNKGLLLANANNTIVLQTRVSSATGPGISLVSTIGTVLQQIYSLTNGQAGLDLANAIDTTVLGATAIGNTTGFAIDATSSRNTFINVAAVDNGTGITDDGSSAFYNWGAIANGSDIGGSTFAPSTVGVTGPTSTAPWFRAADGFALLTDTTLRGAAVLSGSGYKHLWLTAASDDTGCGKEFAQAKFEMALRCSNLVLMSSTEQQSSSFNNGDGLCEDAEQCVAMRNIGAYQGSGPLTALAGPTGNPSPVTYADYVTTGVGP